MSKKLFFLPVLMLLAIAVMTPSCGDKCEKKECANGQCDDLDGTCLCDPGYEYDADGACNVKSQDKYLGQYLVAETCGTATDDYASSISANSDLTKINISKVWNLFQNAVIGSIEGNTVTIARQNPDGLEMDGTRYFVSGTGTYSTNSTGKGQVSFSFTITKENDGGGTIISTATCTMVYTKS
jgi:hypothetical protein